jgi:hypothetical protein
LPANANFSSVTATTGNFNTINGSGIANISRLIIDDTVDGQGILCLNSGAYFRDVNASNLIMNGSDMFVGSPNQEPNTFGGPARSRINFWSTSSANLFEMGTRMGVNENNEAFLSLEPFGGVSNYTISINNTSVMNMTETATTFNHPVNTSTINASNIVSNSANITTLTSSTATITTLNSNNANIINNTNPTITVRSSGGGEGRLALGNTAHGIRRINGNDVDVHTAGNGNTILRTAGGEGLRVRSDGRVQISKRTFQGSQFGGNQNAFDIDAKALNLNDAFGLRARADTHNIVNFYNNGGGGRGNIKGVNSGSIQYRTTSDRRKKEDIVDLENGLEKVMKLKPRTYRWKDGKELDDGFIAQEVFETIPHLIDFNRFKCNISQNDVYHGKLCSCCNIEKKQNGEDYIFGLDYGKFTPYLCKAIQEQQQQIETLQKQYDELLSILTTE